MVDKCKYIIDRANLHYVRKQASEYLCEIDSRLSVVEAGGGGIVVDYLWSTLTSGDPTSGHIAANNSVYANVTELRIHKLNSNGNDMTATIDSLRIGSIYGIFEVPAPAGTAVFETIGDPVAVGDYFTIAVKPNTFGGEQLPSAQDNAVKLHFVQSTKDMNHNELLGVTPDQHHPQSHAHNGSDGSGLVDYNDLQNRPAIPPEKWEWVEEVQGAGGFDSVQNLPSAKGVTTVSIAPLDPVNGFRTHQHWQGASTIPLNGQSNYYSIGGEGQNVWRTRGLDPADGTTLVNYTNLKIAADGTWTISTKSNPTVMKILPDGNVGIGTATPQYPLQVMEGAEVFTDTGWDGLYISSAKDVVSSTGINLRKARGNRTTQTATLSGDYLGSIGAGGHTGSGWGGSKSNIQWRATENFTPTAQGTEVSITTTPKQSSSHVIRMKISDDGNVGIGTTSPVVPLHVATEPFAVNWTPDENVQAIFQDAEHTAIVLASAVACNIRFGDADAEWDGSINYHHGLRRMKFTTAAGDGFMVLDAAGNFGIGTDSPQRPLHVVGVDGAVPTFPSVGGKDGLIFENNNNSNVGMVLAAGKDFAFKIYEDGGTSFDGLFAYSLTNKAWRFGTVANQSMLYIIDDKVGINQTSPAAPLDVRQVGSTFAPSWTIDAYAVARIMSDDYCVLDLASGLTQYINFGDADFERSGQIAYRHDIDTMWFKTNDAERMRINSNGQVLIGKTSSINTYPHLDSIGRIDATQGYYVKDARTMPTIPTTPNTYPMDRNVIFTFDNQIPSGRSWDSALTIQGWAANYQMWQLIGDASISVDPASANPNKWYLRTGNTDDGWGAMNEILHSGNIDTLSYWSASGSDIVNNNSGVVKVGSPSGSAVAGSINISGNYYINGTPISSFIDAPSDGNLYARKNAAWASIGTGAGTVSDLASSPTTTQVTITNTGGNNAIILSATTSRSGVMTASQVTSLNSKISSANLSYSRTSTAGTVSCSAGTNATVLQATNTLAGLMTAQDKAKLDSIANLANNYDHPNFTTRSISMTGATVPSAFTSNNEGHVTGFTTRTLTAANIGAADASTAMSQAAASPTFVGTSTSGSVVGNIQFLFNASGFIIVTGAISWTTPPTGSGQVRIDLKSINCTLQTGFGFSGYRVADAVSAANGMCLIMNQGGNDLYLWSLNENGNRAAVTYNDLSSSGWIDLNFSYYGG